MNTIQYRKNNLYLVKQTLENVARRELPRILTQFCRDPNNKAFGCVDRNWWHYKIRDFPSIILQQAALTIHIANKLNIYDSGNLNYLIEGAINFWARRVMHYGAFEEYYPWEKGYPPLAFSTLSICILLKDYSFDTIQIKKGLVKAVNQLTNRFESKASNQQIAGLAALAHIKNLFPDLVSNRKFEKLSKKSLLLQNNEGWFNEYGGPDLGYLSVTLDCLWDLYDATKDETFINSASRSLKYIHHIISWSKGNNIGIHNSRNTDYIVPYGICRFLNVNNNCSEIAFDLLIKLYKNADNHQHFFASVDDRYWCHYIGTSLFRCLGVIPDNVKQKKILNRKDSFKYFDKSGYIFLKLGDKNLMISTKKGGIFSLFQKNKVFSDFGWHFLYKNKELVNNFWSENWQSKFRKNKKNYEISISGYLYKHKQIFSNPLNHSLLRIASLFFGDLIIKSLKNKFIFKKIFHHLPFSREIKIFDDKIIIKDRIKIYQSGKLTRAPRSSKRHVSSSDSFHPEDFIENNFRSNIKKISNSEKEIITRYFLK